MTASRDTEFVSIERIAQSILVLREQRVLLDSDLAAMYGVATKRFNEQFKRNLARFPADFAFQLSDKEAESLRSQFATLKGGAHLVSLRHASVSRWQSARPSRLLKSRA